MKMITKMWLIIATALVVAGVIMFTSVMIKCKWDFTKLSTQKYETNTYEISDEFSDLSLNTDTADIILALSSDGKCRVECYEEEKAKHSVSVKEGSLVIEMINKKSWYDNIGINFGSPKIKVYLPKAEYVSGLIEIKTSTGKICVDNVTVGGLELSASTGNITVSNVICQGDVNTHVSTGKIKLTDVECKNLTSSGDTGDISLTHVIATEQFSIKRSTGDIRIDSSDAAEIFLKTSTGDITGSLLTDKVFIAHTSTGRIDVPKTVTGGRCEIGTDTGNIKMGVK